LHAEATGMPKAVGDGEPESKPPRRHESVVTEGRAVGHNAAPRPKTKRRDV